MKRARLLRYSAWQMKDYAIERGIMVAILAVLNMTGPIFSIRDLDPAERVIAPGSPVAMQIVVVIASLILLGILFSSQELISRSRKQGYYRLVFAKPVNPVAFYGQLFIVHLVGSVLLLMVIAILFSVAAVPLPLARIAAVAALSYLLLGGVGFLMSAFVSRDAIALIVFVALSVLGKNVAATHAGFGVRFANLLIPVDHLAALKPLLVGGNAAPHDIGWVAGYGLVAFVLGLLAVRYRQLAD